MRRWTVIVKGFFAARFSLNRQRKKIGINCLHRTNNVRSAAQSKLNFPKSFARNYSPKNAAHSRADTLTNNAPHPRAMAVVCRSIGSWNSISYAENWLNEKWFITRWQFNLFTLAGRRRNVDWFCFHQFNGRRARPSFSRFITARGGGVHISSKTKKMLFALDHTRGIINNVCSMCWESSDEQ